MKYHGYWSANNSSSYNREGYGYESNNKRELAKTMRAIAKRNTFSGNTGSWSVYEGEPSEDNHAPILSGSVRN